MSPDLRRPRLPSRIVPFLLPCALALAVAAPPQTEPLTNESVVRMFVSGTPVGELILLVERSPVDFDLSSEMIDELRAAGLPALLLEAMQKRQRAVDLAVAPPAEQAPAEEAPPRPLLRLLLDAGDPDGDERRTLRLFQGVHPAVAESLGLRDEEPTFTDLAIFLGCRTADHVPDHWRSKTPLGRDFRFTPRHKLLAFLPGADRVAPPADLHGDTRPDLAVLELAVPEQIEVELEPEITHDLTLGIAVQSGERYYLVASDARDGLILEADGLELRATLGDAGDLSPGSLDVRFGDRIRNPKE